MFNQHYLSVLFPLPSERARSYGTNRLQAVSDVADTFLDTIVDVDDALALKRENTAMGLLQGPTQSGQESKLANGKASKKVNGKTNGMSTGNNSGEDIVFLNNGSGHDARGKTVKELSRLWQYMGGRSPSV